VNFNDLKIPVADADYDGELDDATYDEFTKISVYFRDLPRWIERQIRRYPYVFGCVAWLTHPGILGALAEKRGVGIVVQKEDFLRPDVGGPDKARLRKLYSALEPTERFNFKRWKIAGLSHAGDPTLDAVRCMGIAQRKGVTAPRMHHKFLVFCDYEPVNHKVIDEYDEPYEVPGVRFLPRAVWTGSFNLTNNGNRSFENAVVIKSDHIADLYMREFANVVALSEPLDWEHEYVAPEWRLGS
jgi:hypothetical protein